MLSKSTECKTHSALQGNDVCSSLCVRSGDWSERHDGSLTKYQARMPGTSDWHL